MSTVTPIRPAPVAPDCLILDAPARFHVGASLRSWPAGVPITDAADIALLLDANIPAKRYRLITQKDEK